MSRFWCKFASAAPSVGSCACSVGSVKGVEHARPQKLLQDALRAFRIWYNANSLIQRHRHRTPDQVRADQQHEDMADNSLPMAA